MATKSKTKKKPAKKKKAAAKPKVKSKVRGKKTSARKNSAAPKKKVRGRSRSADALPFVRKRPGADEESGDLQGLSNVERADSESVDELLEEGNAFEAEAVQGVEDADASDGKEVRTHEVPEDDVPSEYEDQ